VRLVTSAATGDELRWMIVDVTEERSRELELGAMNRELTRRLNELSLRLEPKGSRAADRSKTTPRNESRPTS
jgi:hypothetical protein